MKRCVVIFPAALLLAAVLHGADRPRGDDNGKGVPNGRFEIVLFEESFEDTYWASRGWYDGPHMGITADEHVPGSGHSCVWHWKKAGDVKPEGGGARVLFDPVDSITLSFFMKHGHDWEWTGVDWHPHEFHFITTEDDSLIGPAYTHLTVYVEAVNGIPRVSLQDGRNIDESRVGCDLVKETEFRSVAGGNGDSDGYGEGDCYPSGKVHWNGKSWKAGKKYFADEPGPFNKNEWHHVTITLRLNTVREGIGQKDGVILYRFDNELIMDYRNIVFRTGAHPDMKFNQFLMAPYYGPGVPHEQTIWVDELKITTDARRS